MSFGFADEPEEAKGISHETKDILKYQSWKNIKVGQKVKSILTGNCGVISSKEKLLERIEIEWDSGKYSAASKSDMTKVIII